MGTTTCRQESAAAETLFPLQRLTNKLGDADRTLKDVCFLRTLYWNYRCNLRPFSLLLYPNANLQIAANARIVHVTGRLRFGCRWSVRRFKPSELIIGSGAELEINGSFECYTGTSITIDPGARLSLGSGGMNVGVRLSVFKSITVGNDVYISENVTIRDSDNHSVSGGSGIVSAPITIGNNVLIGVNATILKGVTLGDGCVVAAGAVVTRSVPPHALAGGVPARVIRENVSWNL